jgi:uncharacterized protein (DUF2147 family)
MKKLFSLYFLSILLFGSSIIAEDSLDVQGYWKTINEKTNHPESILAIYEYNGKMFGRIIATYNDQGIVDDSIEKPVKRAPGVKGHPFYTGLDIMWNLEKKGKRYSKGNIMDPEKGRVYNAEIWREGSNLIVRGEILIFGRNQTWKPALDNDFPVGFKKPALSTLVPNIQPVK